MINFNINKFSKLLRILAVVFSGMLASSLWFTKTEMWKIYLPIVILLITFERYINK